MRARSMIEVQHLRKQFGGTVAVAGVSFSVEKGETLVLLGTSGSGKTTTLKLLNRLIEPDAGEIFLEGENITRIDPVLLRRRIGYVIQQSGLFPHYTIQENIELVPRLLSWTTEKITARVKELLPQIQVDPALLDRYPQQLSGGQRQRVGIARALAADPPVILMDEPFGALDVLTRARIREEFLTVPALLDKTIIMVTHDVVEAFELGNRIALMDQGKVVQIGTPINLLQEPATDFVRDFLAPQRWELGLRTLSFSDWLSANAFKFVAPSPAPTATVHFVPNHHLSLQQLLQTLPQGCTHLAVKWQERELSIPLPSLLAHF